MNEGADLGIELTEDPQSPRFRRGKAILVINVYKLINGKSVFGVGDEGIKIGFESIVIDDVHACLATTEDQFTLKIPTSNAVYEPLFSLFRDDLYQQSQSHALEIERDPTKNMLLPYWAWVKKQKPVLDILYKEKECKEVKFVWPLIKDVLPLCRCVFGGGEIEISPRILPINVIPAFESAKRRIFMTATLADDSVLISHFNLSSASLSNTVTPSTADDIGYRMILIPQEINPKITDDDLKQFYKRLSGTYNVVIIVPSNQRALYWNDVADRTLKADNLYEGVEELKNGHVGLVVLVNKYDGIDLPKDACRILVIDRLPEVRRKIDEIDQGVLFGSDEILTKKIQKIEQGMGRGIRANSDYCVVFLMGRYLVNDLVTNQALEKLTNATKAQMQLSEQVSEQIRGTGLEEIEKVIKYCLNRNKEWVKKSKEVLINIKYQKACKVNPITVLQRNAFNAALVRNFQTAIDEMTQAVNLKNDKRVKGWLKQQLAEYLHFINPVESQETLKSAVSDNSQVLHPLAGIRYSKLSTPTLNQAQRCADYLASKFHNPNQIILQVNSYCEQLIFQPNTASLFEETVKQIAFFLGFNAQRPEAEFNKGPDVLWEIGQLKYFVIECKNGATTDLISKHDCDQLAGSINWFTTKYDKTCSAIPIIIHPSNCFEYASSPHSETRIITREKLDELKSCLREFAEKVVQSDSTRNPRSINDLLKKESLTANTFIEKFTTKFKVKK